MVSLLLTFALAGQVPEPWLGQITATTGQVYLVRGTQKYKAVHRSGIKAGDVLQTAGETEAGFATAGGQMVCLGPATSVAVTTTVNGLLLRVDEGEVRATSNGQWRLDVITHNSASFLGRGIARVFVDAEGTQVWCEAGSLAIRRAADPVVYTVGEQEQVRIRGAVETASFTEPAASPWRINPRRLQVTSAVAAAYRLSEEGVPVPTPDPQAIPQPPTTTTADAASRNERRQQRPSTKESPQSRFGVAVAASSQSAGTATQPVGSSGGNSPGDNGTRTEYDALKLSGGRTIEVPAGFENDEVPGEIHAVTAATGYELTGVKASDLPVQERTYYSILQGTAAIAGTLPQLYVGGNTPNVVETENGRIPTTLKIPGTSNLFVVKWDEVRFDPQIGRFDFQEEAGSFGPDLRTPDEFPKVESSSPNTSATLYPDDRRGQNQINRHLTSALGEFVLDPNAGDGAPRFEVRLSDQDKIKNDDGTVRVNEDVRKFVVDDFLADERGLTEPIKYLRPADGEFQRAAPRFSELDRVRRAAATVILADQLHDFALRTKQSRFVIDGKIVDISGYDRSALRNPGR